MFSKGSNDVLPRQTKKKLNEYVNMNMNVND